MLPIEINQSRQPSNGQLFQRLRPRVSQKSFSQAALEHLHLLRGPEVIRSEIKLRSHPQLQQGQLFHRPYSIAGRIHRN